MKIAALAGGVGGAKLVDGLAHILPPEDFCVIVNTGDDFTHYGMHISPDVDTVCYNLAHINNPMTGWGLSGDTWNVMETLERLGGDTWFRVGDQDIATHLERTRRIGEGYTISEITRTFCDLWGIKHDIFPMSDDRIETHIVTEELGEITFQEYFVKHHCEPILKYILFVGADQARPSPGCLSALQGADIVVICPSNPWVSIDPILSINGIKDVLAQKKVVAISPIINGKAIKGPAAKMCNEMGFEPNAAAIASHYREMIKGFILDEVDAQQIEEISRWGIICLASKTVMHNCSERMRLAEEILSFCNTL